MITYNLTIYEGTHDRNYVFELVWHVNGWNITNRIGPSTFMDVKEARFLRGHCFANLQLHTPENFEDIMERIWEGVASGMDSDAVTIKKFQQLSDWLSDINRNVPDL